MVHRIIIFTIILVLLGGVLDLVFYRVASLVLDTYDLNRYQNIVRLLSIFSFSILVLLTAVTLYKMKDPYSLILFNKHYFLSGYFIVAYLPKIALFVGWLLHLGGSLIQKDWTVQYILLPVFALAFFNGSLLLYGVLWGKFHYKVEQVKIETLKINPTNSGLKIVQFSDMHIGSFHGHEEHVERFVSEVNKLKPDIIVFTGDMVNIFAKEAEEFVPIIQKLDAKYKLSILGNHDYGEYYHWPSKEALRKNLKYLIDIHDKMGFKLLMNESVDIIVGQDTITVAGVENWGRPPFPQYGNLAKALNGNNGDNFTLLLSHDPTHWELQVEKENKVDLTLSGHTHAMQMGIDLPFFKWSASKYIYKHWNGLYGKKGNQLYVNRGAGFIGFPGRAGMRPEITSIELNHP